MSHLNRKSIGIDARVPLGRGRGWQRYAVDFLRALSKLPLPFDVRVLLPNNSISKKLVPELEHVFSVYVETFDLANEGDYLLSALQARDPKSYLGDVDLLHCLTRFTPKTDIRPVIATVHDIAPMVDPPYKTEIKASTYQAMERLKEYGSRIIAVSKATRDDLIEFAGISSDRIDVSYPGISAGLHHGDTCSYDLGNEELRLIYVGGMGENKNLVRLIRSVLELRCHMAVKLMIVGDPRWGYEALRKELSDSRLGNEAGAVCFTGFVTDESLQSLYRQSHALVMPSLHEGFGLPIVEAMANSLPVCCSRIPVFEEIAGNAAMFFDPFDSGDIVSTLRCLLLDDTLAATLRRRGHKRARHYSWSRSAMQILDIYKKELGQSKFLKKLN